MVIESTIKACLLKCLASVSVRVEAIVAATERLRFGVSVVVDALVVVVAVVGGKMWLGGLGGRVWTLVASCPHLGTAHV